MYFGSYKTGGEGCFNVSSPNQSKLMGQMSTSLPHCSDFINTNQCTVTEDTLSKQIDFFYCFSQPLQGFGHCQQGCPWLMGCPVLASTQPHTPLGCLLAWLCPQPCSEGQGTPGAGHPMAEPQQQLPGSGPGWCGWQGSTGTGSQSQPDSAQLPIAALCAQAAPVRPGVTTHFCHACKMLLPQIAKTNLILI